MDGSAEITAPFRDPRYAPSRLEVEPRPDGGLILTNARPYSTAFTTTNAALDHWAAVAPDRVWLAERSGEGWRTVAYAEAQSRVAALAGGLEALAVGPDRPLLILARNGVDHALITYAAMRIGAPAAPVSPQYGLPGAIPERLAHAAALIRSAAVYVDDAELFGAALDGCEALAGLPVIASRGVGRRIALNSLVGSWLADRARPEQAAKLLLTSGSTGKPKAVVCTQANIALNGAQIAACFHDPDPPVIVNASPWSHSLGANALLHGTLHRGGTHYIDHGQPTPERFGETLRNLAEIETTYHNMVPAGWVLLADALERDPALARTFLARVRVIQYGGAAMPQAICDRVEAIAVRTVGERISFAAGYGATETGPTASNVHWPNGRAGLLGLPVPGTSLKLAPVAGRLEVRIKGPQVSPGYRDLSGALVPLPLDEDGYYRLGDAARLADPADPGQGLVFDGRLSENFKLASGVFVSAGALRVAALSAIGGAAADAVVCGEGQAGVGLLLFLNPEFCRTLAGSQGERTDLALSAEVTNAIRAGLERLNAGAKGGSARVVRALVLFDAPDPVSGEVTDKGYLNQALARARRAAEVARLFAPQPDASVLVL